MRFNVLTDFHFPVVMADGTIARCNPVRALRQAHQIREIATSSPLDRFAVFRFLLALLYWCQGFPHSSGQSDNGQPFPEDWFARLGENPHKFDLLGDEARFYQFAPSSDKDSTPGYLIHEIPTGTNENHFRHVQDNKYGLCPNCCAMGLLRLPPFATAGGSGYRQGINNAPPLFVHPEGPNLAATLRLSWRSQHAPHIGTAMWDNPDGGFPDSSDVGILTGLTWVPHYYWLLDKDIGGECLLCKSANAIRYAHRRKGEPKPEGKDMNWLDPHIINEQIADDKKAEAIMAARPFERKELCIDRHEIWQWMREARGAAAQSGHPHRIIGFATDRKLKMKYYHAYEYRVPAMRDDISSYDEQLQQREQSIRSDKGRLRKIAADYCYIRDNDGLRNAAKRRYDNLKGQPFVIRDIYQALEPRLQDSYITTGSLPGDNLPQERVLLRQAAQSLAGPRHLDAQLVYKGADAPGDAEQAQEFIDKVAAQLQCGELSRARHWAGHGMHQDSEAFDIFTALWWQIGDSHSRNRRINRDAAWLAVKLLARFPWLHANSAVRDAGMAASAPARLAQLLGRCHGDMDERQRFRDRFQRLLSTPLQQTEHALVTLIRCLRRSGDAAHVLNWGALIQDLGAWGTPRTQRRWAYDFANHSPDQGD